MYLFVAGNYEPLVRHQITLKKELSVYNGHAVAGTASNRLVKTGMTFSCFYINSIIASVLSVNLGRILMAYVNETVGFYEAAFEYDPHDYLCGFFVILCRNT